MAKVGNPLVWLGRHAPGVFRLGNELRLWVGDNWMRPQTVSQGPKDTGQVALTFLLLYPVARFIIEYFRADPRGVWRFFGFLTLSESQLISIPIFLFAIIAWPILSRRST